MGDGRIMNQHGRGSFFGCDSDIGCDVDFGFDPITLGVLGAAVVGGGAYAHHRRKMNRAAVTASTTAGHPHASHGTGDLSLDLQHDGAPIGAGGMAGAAFEAAEASDPYALGQPL